MEMATVIGSLVVALLVFILAHIYSRIYALEKAVEVQRVKVELFNNQVIEFMAGSAKTQQFTAETLSQIRDQLATMALEIRALRNEKK